MSAVIQVPSCPGRGVLAQAVITLAKAVSARSVHERLRAAGVGISTTIRSSSVRKTMRGSGRPPQDAAGLRQTTGRCRAGRHSTASPDSESPPAASNPSGLRSARCTGGNAAFGSGPSRGIGRRLTEGTVLEDRLTIAQDRAAFLRAPGAQGVGESRVGDEMSAVGDLRQEAAGDLVLALRAGLESVSGLRAGSIRCPGSNRSRNAGRAAFRWRPSSDRTACRRRAGRARPRSSRPRVAPAPAATAAACARPDGG